MNSNSNRKIVFQHAIILCGQKLLFLSVGLESVIQVHTELIVAPFHAAVLSEDVSLLAELVFHVALGFVAGVHHVEEAGTRLAKSSRTQSEKK